MDSQLQYMLGAVICGVLGILTLFAVVGRRRLFLRPDTFKAARLIEKETITHNTSRYRFSLGNGTRLGLPIGQHISFQFVDSAGKDVMRSYTPVTGDETIGYVDFVIKVYPQGKMSQHVDQLSINQSILMRGPKGRFQYARGMKRALGTMQLSSGTTEIKCTALASASESKLCCRVNMRQCACGALARTTSTSATL